MSETAESALVDAASATELRSRGRMIVKIGMAVVRPAEFIILQFSHKLPES